MAKRTTELGDDGQVVSYKNTRARRKSESKLIGWTPGPQTVGQKARRALWG